MFTGSPNISLPIQISEEVPLSISYNAMGIKPEEHHGWLGSNWNLTVGGMITRIKRGQIDELKAVTGAERGYFTRLALMNGTQTTWADEILSSKTTQSTLTTAATTQKFADLEPDEFVFNFNQYSGSFLKNHEGKWIFRGNNPSEFQLKSIDIQENLTDIHLTGASNGDINYQSMIMGFVIQTSDGTEYTFGGDQTDQGAIDISFSLNGVDVSKPNQQLRDVGQFEAFAMAWHLTKIKYINGKEINFEYEKDAFCMTGRKSRTDGLTISKANQNSTATIINRYVTSPTERASKSFSFTSNGYLKKIRTPYEIVEFSKALLTNVHDYLDGDLDAPNIKNDFLFRTGIQMDDRKWFKLTDIKTYKRNADDSKGTLLLHYNFEYQNSLSKRLQLLNIKQKDVVSTSNSKLLYSFEYFGGQLSDYMAMGIDHWGFENQNSVVGGAGGTFTETSMQTARNSSPVMQNEILNKILYPTGGYTQFEFEPNDYYAFCNNTPLTNNSNGPLTYTVPDPPFVSNTRAGGLRIKKIKNFDGATTREKEYLYVKNYSNANVANAVVSSGILANTPQYFDIATGQTIKTNTSESSTTSFIHEHSYLDEGSVNPLNTTSGSPVTYSEVVEKNQDGSYTIYKFSNFDNTLYRNRQSFKTQTRSGTTIINPKKDPITDYEHLRGRMLETKMYHQNDRLVKEIKNTYTSTLLDNEAVRAVYNALAKIQVLASTGGDQPATELRAVAYYIHTSPVYLLSTETKDYFYSETTPVQTSIVTTTTTNEYDTRKNLIRQTVSNGDAKSNTETFYRYAYNPANTTNLVVNPNVSETQKAPGTVPGTEIGARQLMIDNFMIGIPLETTNNFEGGQKVEFNRFDGKILPAKLYSKKKIAYQANQISQFDEEFEFVSYSQFDLPYTTKQFGYATNTLYNWDRGLLRSKVFGELFWEYDWDFGKRLLNWKKDENKLKMMFAYDGYRRLSTVTDRVDEDNNDGDPQSTTQYTYQYKNATNLYSYIGTSTTYKGVTTPLSTKQYFDDLGRPIQVVRENYTPNANTPHQKTATTYDNLGRQDKSYLPWESNTAPASGVPNNQPYAFPTYEASPLSRVVRQTNLDGTFITTVYGTNAANEVRLFIPLISGTLVDATSTGFYAANTLFKTTIYNENETQKKVANPNYVQVPTAVVYKDKLGRVVLTRKYLDANTAVNTYNVYDDYGQLVVVITPGTVVGNENGFGIVSANSTGTFQYIYDNQGRLAAKTVPNAEVQKFYYDNRDLLVLTQDGNMRADNANKHLATIYDDLGRIKKTGFVAVTPTLGQNVSVTESQITDLMTHTIYYPNKSWVQHQGAKVLKPNGVSTSRNFVWSYIERRTTNNYTGNPVWSAKQHLLYNGNGTADIPITDYELNGVDWSVSAYDGAQKPTYSIRYLFGDPTKGSQEVRTWQSFEYDNGQRLKNLRYNYGLFGAGISDPQFILSNMNYDYLDRMTEKNTAFVNNKYLQSTDFAYNVRGWLTHINQGFNNANLDYPIFACPNINQYFTYYSLGNNSQTPFQTPLPNSGDANPDLFKQDIRYSTPNTYPNGNLGAVTPQYNGNISQTEWQIAGREAQAYTYNYDNLNRLTEANYSDIHSNAWNTRGWTTPYETDNKFGEKLTYDLRGNITSLVRNGFKGVPENNQQTPILCADYGVIDNLAYNYHADSLNNLTKVVDNSNDLNHGFKSANSTANQTGIYVYDKNGNLIADPNKRIIRIQYNYLNLPQVIEFSQVGEEAMGGKIIFIYDATGVKLRKIVAPDYGVPTTYDYINGVEYKNDVLQRLSHTEGAVVLNPTTGVYEQEYVIKDHLGNTRVTYSDTNNDAYIAATEIKQINHYYPFGLNMEGNWNGVNGQNKYQYNGKEWNNDDFGPGSIGLGWNDYGARFYDPAVGRWWSVDPLADIYKRWSPYAYTKDNPIRFIDPNGMFSYDFQIDSEEKRMRDNKAKNDGRHGWKSVESGKGKDDWIRRGDQYTYVKDQGMSLDNARAKYGNDVSDVRGDNEGHTYMSAGGNEVKLGENGKWNYTAIDKASEIVNVAGFAADAHEGSGDINSSVKKLAPFKSTERYFKLVGVTSGYLGVAKSGFDLYQKPHSGNILKLGWDLGMTRAFWLVGLVDAGWEMTGTKDSFFDGLSVLDAEVIDIPERFKEVKCKK
jgi:RHS repeat-associated protein